MAVGEHKTKGQRLRVGLTAAACGIVVLLALALPVDRALQFLGTPGERAMNAVLVFALVTLLAAAGLLAKRRAMMLILLPVLMILLAVRLLFYGLVHFSGQGFGPELFLHLEPESLRIAWYEYDNLIYRAAGVAVVGAAAFWGLVRAGSQSAAVRRWPVAGLAILALPLLIAGRDLLPEWRLWLAWQAWQRPGTPAGRPHGEHRLPAAVSGAEQPLPKEAARWRDTGLLETDLTRRAALRAEAPERPRNLILLYVEGLTSAIVEHPEYPDLMPNVKRLQREYGWIDSFHTSGFVTIEGLANSQCGLLFPFRGHGSGFAGRQMLAQSLPCLGDVLAEAGYEQIYLGGSPMSFTGKGRFLDAHGYDQLKGWEYWKHQGYEHSPGHWGLGDVTMLEQARRAIAERQDQERPFNVTALTVGTHIPGYSYAGCTPYRGGAHRFLDALHCTDQIVAAWIEQLRDDELLADSILVVTGDHPVFANPQMQDLFGPAIHETRMPLIVIGGVDEPAAHDRGASFDLAPTLLDLLGIRHNAQFAMGRSLAGTHDRPDYLVTRRGDIHRGEPVHNPARGCDPSEARPEISQAPSLPLSACNKRNLIDLLHRMASNYSHRPAAINCAGDTPAEVRVPDGDVGPVSFTINGRDWSNRFSWRGRMTHPTEPGLYALALGRHGRPTAASFLLADTLSAEAPKQLPQDVLQAHSILIAWRPEDPNRVDLSVVLAALPEAQRGAGAWLARPDERRPIESRLPGHRPAAVLSIGQATCRSIRG